MLDLKSLKFKVSPKLGLVIHAFLFVGLNAILISLNIMTNTAYFWAKWPLIVWGAGFTIHALMVTRLILRRQSFK